VGVSAAPLGVLLAGGEARRMGGDKLRALLRGRPLALWALDALRDVCDEVVVAAKAGTALPALPAGTLRLDEPDEPRHPLAGVVAALGHAGPGRSVVAVAADLPLVPAPLLRALLAAPADHAVAVAGERVQPLCARVGPAALGPLEAAMGAGQPATRAVLGLRPALVEAEAAWLMNVNTTEDLAAAEALLA
jgi:molybdenum cofactor guanylyltransferase